MVIVQQIPNYYDSLLLRRQNYGIKLAGGWVFGKSVEFDDLQINMDRYPNIPALSSAVIVPPKAAADEWNEWKHDPDNESIFWEWDDNRLIQAYIGIFPSPARLFRRVPSPVPRGNLSKIKITSLTINTLGYVDGTPGGSPYGIPSVLTELLIPKEVLIEFAVFNPLLVPLAPKFNIKIRRHSVKYYDPNKKPDLEVINAMWAGKIPWKPWSPGAEAWEYDAGSKLNVDPIKFD